MQIFSSFCTNLISVFYAFCLAHNRSEPLMNQLGTQEGTRSIKVSLRRAVATDYPPDSQILFFESLERSNKSEPFTYW